MREVPGPTMSIFYTQDVWRKRGLGDIFPLVVMMEVKDMKVTVKDMGVTL